MNIALKIGLLGSILGILGIRAAAPVSPIQFKDVSQETGITFVHTDGGQGKQRYIVESVASGIATFDYDLDGNIDILFLNGAPLPGSPEDTPSSGNALYRNQGDWKFTDKTTDAGLDDRRYHLGVCVGDYNNDGFPDVFLSNFGPDILYRNNGDGTFTDVTLTAGVSNGNQVGAGASFLDIDADGHLDLFIANYCDFSIKEHKPRQINGHPAYAGPMMYGPVPDTLYRNNGDGTFTDFSHKSGIASVSGTGMGVVSSDYDHDGDIDIIVGNDAMANFVWQNDGKGKFKEVGLFSGLAYDSNGIGLGTMGVDCADYNNDGKMDFYMTSYQKQWGILYQNEGAGFFMDATRITGAGAGTYNEVTWGLGLEDFDNDGFRDLYIACGHLQDNIRHWDDTVHFEARNILLRNMDGENFVDISSTSGTGMDVKLSSRGAAFDDLDNDGDIDVVVLNTRKAPTILRNDSSTSNHWARIRLEGTQSNREAIGARIKVIAGELTLMDELRSGRGYQSHYGTLSHFGLGQEKKIDQVEVWWPSGKKQIFKNIPVDRVIKFTEGRAQ
ncbi:CRTAC1 family protein [Verrucomicrobia bacterium]|nr:CRTAC1 family protein [Verrucomicrobiota bacterium]